MKLIAVLTYIAAILTAMVVVELALLGQPPKHCHYFVPVKAHPGIYSCSQYPRPVTVP